MAVAPRFRITAEAIAAKLPATLLIVASPPKVYAFVFTERPRINPESLFKISELMVTLPLPEIMPELAVSPLDLVFWLLVFLEFMVRSPVARISEVELLLFRVVEFSVSAPVDWISELLVRMLVVRFKLELLKIFPKF